MIQSEIDLEVARQKGLNRIQGIKDEGRIDHARRGGWLKSVAQRIKAVFDKTQEDVKEMEIQTRLEEERIERSKARAAREIIETATKRLNELMASHEYTDEQKQKLAAMILEEAKEKIQGNGK